jgi:hypothetical protein
MGKVVKMVMQNHKNILCIVEVKNTNNCRTKLFFNKQQNVQIAEKGNCQNLGQLQQLPVGFI